MANIFPRGSMMNTAPEFVPGMEAFERLMALVTKGPILEPRGERSFGLPVGSLSPEARQILDELAILNGMKPLDVIVENDGELLCYETLLILIMRKLQDQYMGAMELPPEKYIRDHAKPRLFVM